MTTKKKHQKREKSKFRVGQLVSVPWDNLKHKVKYKDQNSHGYWHYYITGLSGEFSESDLSIPTKAQRKKYRC